MNTTARKSIKGICIPFLLFLFFLIPFFIPPFTHAASTAQVGPFDYPGTIKIYYMTLSAGSDNWLDISAKSGSIRVVMPSCMDGQSCPIGSATTLKVEQGEAVDIYFHGDEKQGQGFTAPTGKWFCGTSESNDGKVSFQKLEDAAEKNGLPIIDRQCWEDVVDGSDNDWNDVVIIYTYEVGSMPERLQFLGTKLGPRPTMIDTQPMYFICPTGIGMYVFTSPTPCLVKWSTESAQTRSTPLLDQILDFLTTLTSLHF